MKSEVLPQEEAVFSSQLDAPIYTELGSVTGVYGNPAYTRYTVTSALQQDAISHGSCPSISANLPLPIGWRIDLPVFNFNGTTFATKSKPMIGFQLGTLNGFPIRVVFHINETGVIRYSYIRVYYYDGTTHQRATIATSPLWSSQPSSVSYMYLQITKIPTSSPDVWHLQINAGCSIGGSINGTCTLLNVLNVSSADAFFGVGYTAKGNYPYNYNASNGNLVATINMDIETRDEAIGFPKITTLYYPYNDKIFGDGKEKRLII